MIIKTKYNGNWVFANPDYCEAFRNYKNRPMYSREQPVETGSLSVYRTNNDAYLPTYIRDGNEVYPITDFEDVRVFLVDANPTDWYAARNYQIWAYYDFIYDNEPRKVYASKYSSYLAYPADTVEIDIDGLSPNIIFSISRNDNNSVYYERNDGNRARVRICDNHTARIGYRGYYSRMTIDIDFVFGGIVSVAGLELPSSLILEQTDIEEVKIKTL